MLKRPKVSTNSRLVVQSANESRDLQPKPPKPPKPVTSVTGKFQNKSISMPVEEGLVFNASPG